MSHPADLGAKGGKGAVIASELISFIKSNWNFSVGCACYPEKHLEAESLEKDIEDTPPQREDNTNKDSAYMKINGDYNANNPKERKNYDTPNREENNNNNNYQTIETNLRKPKTIETNRENRDASKIREVYVNQEKSNNNMQPENINEPDRKRIKRAEFQEYEPR